MAQKSLRHGTPKTQTDNTIIGRNRGVEAIGTNTIPSLRHEGNEAELLANLVANRHLAVVLLSAEAGLGLLAELGEGSEVEVGSEVPELGSAVELY